MPITKLESTPVECMILRDQSAKRWVLIQTVMGNSKLQRPAVSANQKIRKTKEISVATSESLRTIKPFVSSILAPKSLIRISLLT